LLPVVSTIEPNLLDNAMSSVPRMRDWRFSSAVSNARPLNSGARPARKASKIGRIAISL